MTENRTRTEKEDLRARMTLEKELRIGVMPDMDHQRVNGTRNEIRKESALPGIDLFLYLLKKREDGYAVARNGEYVLSMIEAAGITLKRAWAIGKQNTLQRTRLTRMSELADKEDIERNPELAEAVLAVTRDEEPMAIAGAFFPEVWAAITITTGAGALAIMPATTDSGFIFPLKKRFTRGTIYGLKEALREINAKNRPEKFLSDHIFLISPKGEMP